jgi:hypothetical protein
VAATRAIRQQRGQSFRGGLRVVRAISNFVASAFNDID